MLVWNDMVTINGVQNISEIEEIKFHNWKTMTSFSLVKFVLIIWAIYNVSAQNGLQD